MEQIDYRRKNSDYTYDSLDDYHKRLRRVSALVSDSVNSTGKRRQENSGQYVDRYIAAGAFLRNFAGIEE